MAFGHICSLCSAFTYIAVLMLGLGLLDVEASSRTHVIHRKVGDTVELPSYLPTEGVITAAFWKYGKVTVADKDGDVSTNHQFKDRVELNPTNFSLTVRKLTLQDSGDFSFLSAVNDQQRDTVIITLHVHEPITQQPSLKQINSTYDASVESCTVLLECSTSSGSTVTYKWTVENQTWTGPKLQHVFKEQDGDTTFTCTVSTFVSEKSASRTIKCSSDISPQETGSSRVSLIIWPLVGISVILLLLALLHFIKWKDLWRRRLTQSETVNQDESQQHVYSSLLHGDGSVYETVRGSEGDGCVYETMRGCEDTATGGSPDEYINVPSAPIQTNNLDKEDE